MNRQERRFNERNRMKAFKARQTVESPNGNVTCLSEEEFTFEQQEIADATKKMFSKITDLSPAQKIASYNAMIQMKIGNDPRGMLCVPFAAKVMQELIDKNKKLIIEAYPWAF